MRPMSSNPMASPQATPLPIDELDPNLLRSPFFKIILKPHCTAETQDTHPEEVGQATLKVSESPTPATEFFIHKALLASLSNELDKHVNNDMREGQESTIELTDVDEETLKGFLLWAYTRDYRTPNPKSPSALLYHTKLYALADRFNIPALSDLSYSRITTLLLNWGMVASSEDVSSVVSAMEYAWENLPLATMDASGSTASACSSLDARNSGLPSDRLLRYFTQYAAWALDALRNSCKFMNLLSSSHDFAVAVVMSSRAAELPPSGCASSTKEEQHPERPMGGLFLQQRNAEPMSPLFLQQRIDLPMSSPPVFNLG
ncbi:hypothetical protein BDZ91DRAFT_430478 [Kalaharituber pfeilii]|nr:hypothetical protein BDZ91DRAFT_430478 [Kalaharituber pfeilii]